MARENGLRWVPCLMLVLTSVWMVGCGPGNPRKEIKGKVTLKGAPVKDGVISFEPLATDGQVTKKPV